MTDDDRPQPQSTVQAASQVAGDVVAGLKTQPLLLGIVVLNVIGICAALYFLNLLAANNQTHMSQILTQHAQQFESIVRMCLPRSGGDYRLQSDDPPPPK